MSAHTPTPSRTDGRVDVRLPWWALALPMLAFAALLVLIVDPAQAQAAGTDPAVGGLLEYLKILLSL
ncbi:hypothetical protein ACWF94_07745 [Streptomyces sp. NPDC055078]